MGENFVKFAVLRRSRERINLDLTTVAGGRRHLFLVVGRLSVSPWYSCSSGSIPQRGASSRFLSELRSLILWAGSPHNFHYLKNSTDEHFPSLEMLSFTFAVCIARVNSAASSFPASITRSPQRRIPLSGTVASRIICTTAKETTRIEETSQGIRINKCFKSFASRRESDSFVASGRVRINGEVATSGARVFPGDNVELDGNTVEWERLTVNVQTETFTYLKHWKDRNVICTTDDSVPNNIIRQVEKLYKGQDRIFPVGRLDEQSTGLILLTSDGRLSKAMLGAGKNCAKDYLVTPDMYVTDEDLQRLEEGIEITTEAQRDRNVRKRITAPTLPCEVKRYDGLRILLRLQEGRNRQIRKMLGALGYTTRRIRRIGFMGITLDGLAGPGDVKELSVTEMALVRNKLKG